jgi:predicted nucleotidyltransferase
MADTALTPLRALVESNRERIKAIASEHKGRGIALFGSVARGDEVPDSDIDFLVEFERGSSLFDLADLEDELTALLGHRVDVVSAGGLRPRDHAVRSDARWL